MNAYVVEGFNKRPMAISFYPNEGKSKQPIVVYAHGINGFKDWGGMPQIAELFVQHGLNFLAFNFSHNGTTVNRPTDFNDLDAYATDSYLKRQYDLQCIVSWIEKHLKDVVDSLKIYLIGHSRGGTDSILFAAQNNDISKLISWSAPSEAKTPWRNWSSEKMAEWKDNGVVHLKNGRTGQLMPINYTLYEEFKSNKQQLDVEHAARSLDNKPWLIIHGEEDEAVFIKEAYTLKSWQPNAAVHIIPKTGHTFDRKHPESNEAPLPQPSVALCMRSIAFLLQNA